jgi:hypothetical protein
MEGEPKSAVMKEISNKTLVLGTKKFDYVTLPPGFKPV